MSVTAPAAKGNGRLRARRICRATALSARRRASFGRVKAMEGELKSYAPAAVDPDRVNAAETSASNFGASISQQ